MDNIIPKGFLEDPYVYPQMSCPICGYRFKFMDPFNEYTRVRCHKCEKESDIPDEIFESFIDNLEFRHHLNSRDNRNDGGTKTHIAAPIGLPPKDT